MQQQNYGKNKLNHVLNNDKLTTQNEEKPIKSKFCEGETKVKLAANIS